MYAYIPNKVRNLDNILLLFISCILIKMEMSINIVSLIARNLAQY